MKDLGQDPIQNISNKDLARNRNLKEFSDLIMRKSYDENHFVGHGWDLIEKKPNNQLANNYKKFAKNYPARIKPKVQISEILESGVG